MLTPSLRCFPFPSQAGTLSRLAELVPRLGGPAALFTILAGNFPDARNAEPLQSCLIAAFAQPTCELSQIAFCHVIILN
jgi:hypothetical protein